MPVIRGEEPLLTNLLVNLVSNSMKFRRPDVPPKVHISARLVDDEWEITCQDNGIGIEPEFADKIFVIFQRLHSKDAYPGTGIGLAIVKKIVEYHGGRVWVDTDVDEGTAIRFTLPASADLDEAATVDGRSRPTAPADDRTGRWRGAGRARRSSASRHRRRTDADGAGTAEQPTAEADAAGCRIRPGRRGPSADDSTGWHEGDGGMTAPADGKSPIEVLLVEDDPGDVLMTQEAFEEHKLRNRLTVVSDGARGAEPTCARRAGTRTR